MSAKTVKDHLVYVVAAACAATASATWIACEKLRVEPIRTQLEKQLKMTEASPFISKITTTRANINGRQSVQQLFAFHDPQGDARFLSYVVLQTNATDIRIRSSSIRNPKDEQIAGATTEGNWDCGEGRYYVTLRAIISDAAGNVSVPQDYSITCN